MFRKTLPLALAVVLAVGCTGEDPVDQQPDAGPVDDVNQVDDVNDTNDDEPPQPDQYPVTTCDDLNPEVCAFPWPSNLYMEPDDTRASGYRLTFGDESLPANNSGTHISPRLFDHLDGYDLGVPIMAQFPNLDDTNLPDEYEIAASMDDDAPILLYEVDDDGLQRVPYWAELDMRESDAEQQTLFIRPAEILNNNTRYIVALRDLVDTDGDEIAPSDTFARLVEGDTEDHSILRYRQHRFDDIFERLDGEGIDADSLTLAWDFVTASSEALHGPMLQIRDDAFGFAADEGIDWSVEQMTWYSDDDNDPDYHPHIGVEIEATMEVPHYMEPYEEISDTWKLHRDDDGQIQRNATRQTSVFVRVPHRAVGGEEVGVLVYGHGLLGSRYEIGADHWGLAAEEMGLVFAAVDMAGMSHAEADAAQEVVIDVNHFIALSDRLHQGMAEYLLVAHTAADALVDLEDPGDEPRDFDIAVDPDDLHYAGGSQGGIFGGTFMALTPDVERGYLAVPGNNYSTLLQRSTNFDQLNDTMTHTYDTAADVNLNIAAMSLLWSTTEPVSFLRHIRKQPLEDDDPRDVFLAVAKGDYQVATITNENGARSDIEIPLLENYDEQREPYGVDAADYPHAGSGTVLYDFGNPWPEPGNQPPDDDIGDPHGWLVHVDEHLGQVETFLRDGEIVDICNGAPCQYDAP